MTKRELAKLGIERIADLEKPLPSGRIYMLSVVVRVRDNGTSHNEVKRFEFLRVDKDPFAPPDNSPPPITQKAVVMKPEITGDKPTIDEFVAESKAKHGIPPEQWVIDFAVASGQVRPNEGGGNEK
jgi:hypothetical protein